MEPQHWAKHWCKYLCISKYPIAPTLHMSAPTGTRRVVLNLFQITVCNKPTSTCTSHPRKHMFKQMLHSLKKTFLRMSWICNYTSITELREFHSNNQCDEEHNGWFHILLGPMKLQHSNSFRFRGGDLNFI